MGSPWRARRSWPLGLVPLLLLALALWIMTRSGGERGGRGPRGGELRDRPAGGMAASARSGAAAGARRGAASARAGSGAPAGGPGAASPSPSRRAGPLHGAVVDLDDGNPLPGARVTLGASGEFEVADAEGRFAFESVPYPASITAEAPEHTAIACRIDQSPPGGLVIPLPAGLGLDALVVEKRTLGPIPGALVRIEDEDRRALRSGVTDDRGRVRLELDRISIEAREGRDLREALGRQGAIVWAEAKGYNRIATGHALLSLRLDRPLQIELRRTKGIPGRVVDERGAGVPRAHVYWAWTVQIDLLKERRTEETRADEEGRFVLGAPVHASRCFVAAFHPDLAAGYTVLQRDALASGEAFEIVLGPPCTLRGLVLDPSGAGVSGALVWLDPEETGLTSRQERWLERFSLEERGRPTHLVRTGADGAFELGPLAPGRYAIRAEHRDFAPDPSGDGSITLPYAGVWVARLREGGRISGVIADEDGNPPPKANILLQPADPAERSRQAPRAIYDDRDGSFAVAGMRDTSYLMHVFCPGLGNAQMRVRPGQHDLLVVVKGREPQDPDARDVEADVTCRGRGITIPSLHYALHDPDTGERIQRGICAVTAGRATLERLPRRILDLAVRPRLYQPVILRRLQLDREEPPRIRIDLERGREVTGQLVLRGDPDPLPRLLILLDETGMYELFTAGVQEDGRFAFLNMTGGTFIPRLSGVRWDYRFAGPVTIGPLDQTVVIEVEALAGPEEAAQPLDARADAHGA